MPHRSVKRVGPIVFKEIFSLVSSISIFGSLTNCVVDDLSLKGCWLAGTLSVKHNYIEGMIKQYLPVNLSEWPFIWEKLHLGLALKSVPPYYIQTIKQTVDGTDKTQIFYVPPV